MAELVQLGKELGYEGQELREWVTRQQEIQRVNNILNTFTTIAKS